MLGQARVGDRVSLLLRGFVGEWLVGEDGSVGEGLMMMRLSRLYKHREIVNSSVYTCRLITVFIAALL